MKTALVVGTGMDSLAAIEGWAEVNTPFGPAFLAAAVLGGREIILLRRHGPALNVPPHLINYKANIWALRNAGVECIIATAVVGSLRDHLPPGSLAIVDDFIDFTKRRDSTFFDQPGEVVVHVDFSTPYCPRISQIFKDAAKEIGTDLADGVTYLCVDGPRYETPAEIKMFAQWGADVVGMTGVPEVTLARESRICYAALAIVSNYAAGIQDHPLSHQEVLTAVNKKRQTIHNLIETTIKLLPEDFECICRP